MKMVRFIALFIITFFSLANCDKGKESETNWDSVYQEQGLVPVSTERENIIVELRYSTTNNFIGKDVYGNLEQAYLQPEASEKLISASKLLEFTYPDLKLLIWDAARPRRIQQVLWDSVDVSPEERPRYVANPKTGSIHNYGAAIDITLADSTGKPLDLGTDYDDFTYLANIDKEDELVENGELTEQQVTDRRILRMVMVESGFIPLKSEWWHFDAFSKEETKERFTIVE
jgi:D-alanyl-D-alanine dipeptidase